MAASQMQTAARQSPRALRLLLAASVVLTTLLVSAPSVLATDAWAGNRYCASFQNCKVTSNATGNVYHYRCNTSWANCVLKASWSNGGNFQSRTSYHGSGTQGVVINVSGTLSSQSATCVCLSPPCPE